MHHIFRTVSYFLVFLAGGMGLCLIFPFSAYAVGYGLIEDDAHVLSISQVSQAAQRFPGEIDIYTTSSFRGNEIQLTRLAHQHLPSNTLDQVVVIEINVAQRQVAVVGNMSVQLNDQQYREAEHGFLDSLRHNPSYTDATVTALALLTGSSQSEKVFNGLILLVFGGSLVALYFILRPFLNTPPTIIIVDEERQDAVDENESKEK